jgi:pimeloyl-ACP methyl ester carboxylesterase
MGGLLHPLADAGFRAVAIDLPGHGDTGTGQTDAIAMSSALREAAQALGAEFVIGHSMGGLGTVVALRDGLRVRGAVLLSAAVRLEHALSFFSKSLNLPEKSAQGLSDTIERRFGRSVWSDFAADRIAQKLSIPALIVHDVEDPQVPVTDAVMLTNAWQGARFQRTRGLGHMKALRDPEVISSVADFLTRLSEKELVAVGS